MGELWTRTRGNRCGTRRLAGTHRLAAFSHVRDGLCRDWGSDRRNSWRRARGPPREPAPFPGAAPGWRASLTDSPYSSDILEIKQEKTPSRLYLHNWEGVNSSGGRIRTYDLWVMSPASYRAAPPRAACRSATGLAFQPLAVSDLYSVTQTHPNVKSAGERPFLVHGPPLACMTPRPRACSAHRGRAPRSPCRSPRVTNAPLGTRSHPSRQQLAAPGQRASPDVSDWQRRGTTDPLMSATGSVRSKSGRFLTPHCQ